VNTSKSPVSIRHVEISIRPIPAYGDLELRGACQHSAAGKRFGGKAKEIPFRVSD